MFVRFRRPEVTATLALLLALVPLVALGQSAPIVGTAPVTIQTSTPAPLVSSNFTADVVVDLTSVTGSIGGGSAAAALSAFRIPITFDRTRLQVVSVIPAAGTPFATATLSATAIADANATGRLTVAASIGTSSAPAGVVPVVTLTLRATASGAASLAGIAEAVSLASAIQASGASIYGPVAIPPKAVGGGVTVQTAAALRLSMMAGPSPTTNGGQVVYALHAENTGGSPAHGTTIVVTVPSGVALIGASGGGTINGDTIQWSAGDLAAGATFDVTFGAAVTANAGTTITIAPATATSSDAPAATSNVVPLTVAATASVKPGMIVAASSYGYGSGVLYDVTSGTAVEFARVPSGGWTGALLFTATGRLIASSEANGGSLFDATAGGDLSAARPFAEGVGGYISGLAADAAGNIYVSCIQSNYRIKRVTATGAVTAIGPALQYPGSLLIAGNTLYVSEGGSGSVKTIDLSTFAVATFATGFPAGTDHFAGQLVRNSLNRVFVLWGQNATNLGLFDITTGGDFANATPVTAKNAFRIDVNQVGIDSHDAIYFAGNGTGAVWRSTQTSGLYSAATVFANGTSDGEALAVYPLPDLPLIAVSTSASPSPAVSSRTLIYTINYENRGGRGASNATLSAVVPSGVTFSSASDAGTYDGTRVNWTLGAISPSATGTRTFTVNVSAAPGATLDPAAVVLGADSMTAVSATLPQLAVVAPPDLHISVTPSAISAPVNSYLTYAISYSNTGGSSSTNTIVQQTLPSNTTFSTASDGGTLSSGVVTWSRGTVNPGATSTLTLVVKIGGTAGTVITNNNCRISADLAPAVTAAAVTTNVTAASTITATVVAAPNPVVPGTQVNVVITYKSTATTALNNVVITAPLPASTTYLSSNNGGALSGNAVVWTIAQVAAGATAKVRYSIRTDAAPNTTFIAAATISSAENPAGGAGPSIVSVKPYPAALAPGTILNCPSFGDANIGRVSAILNGVKTFFAQTFRGTWVGPLIVGPNGHVYGSVDGSSYDITAGGDLTAATPISTTALAFGQSMAFDDAGNLYRVSNSTNSQVEKITPEGDVTSVGPTFLQPGGMTIFGNTMWVSDGGTGSVYVVDLTTGQLTSTLASGFPTGTDHFSGQLMLTRQGRLYVLWGAGSTNLGLFDITNGGTYSSMQPVTARGAFRIDVNQSGIAPNDDIYFSGNGNGAIYRAPFVNGTYGPTVSFMGGMGDNEALAIFPAYKLAITGTASASHVNRGDPVTFTFAVQNNSIVSIDHVIADVPIPTGFTFTGASSGGVLAGTTVHWSLGTLAAGAQATISITGTVVAADGSSVVMRNYSAGADGRATAIGSDVTVTVDRPLNIQAAAAPDPVVVGGLLTYTLTYENLNATTATNAIISDTLPAGSSFVSASNAGAFANGVVTWNVGTIPSGGEGSVSVVVRADALPALVNATYSVSSTEFGVRAGAPITTSVLPLPAQLSIAAAGPAQVTAGDNIIYTFTYRNSGGSTATDVVLRDTLPSGTTFVSASGGTLAGNDIVWQLGAAAAGAQDSVSAVVATSANAQGSITNSAYSIGNATQTATGPAVVTNLIAPPPPAPLAIAMSAQPNPVNTGALLTYTITISNPAAVAADAVIVTDTIPSGTTFVSSTGPAAVNGETMQWTLGTLQPSESVVLGLTVAVTAASGATITNDGAVVSATSRDASSSGAVQTAVTEPAASLALSATAPVSVLAGGSITYTLFWTNNGPSLASGATLSVPMPSDTIFISASDGGTIANNVVTWALGTLDPSSEGFVAFTVAVVAPPGSTIALTGASIAAPAAKGATAETVLTGVIVPLPIFTGALTLDKSSYIAPEVVHQSASFTYVSGGIGIVSGLTATLATVTASGTVVASTTRTIDGLAAGVSVPMAFDWDTASSPSANYAASFTVTAADGSALVQTTVPFSVAAPDAADLNGTIAATNSPVVVGANLVTRIDIANGSIVPYSPLPLEIDVVDPATLNVLRRVTASVNVAAFATATTNVDLPTTGLALGDYTIWLTTPAGSGRLLAQTTATVIAPTFTLAPPESTIVAGTSGDITATLSTAATTSIDIALTSSDVAVASVPGSITIPAGTTSVTFPVTGIAAGGPVTITGTISNGGATATAKVRVVMTGAISATLEVYERENEQFDVTINNGGQTALTNAPFTIEIRNGETNALVDTIPFTASVGAGAAYHSVFTYSTSTLAPQSFRAVLVWNGIAPAEPLATATFTVLKSPLLRLSGSVRANPRILIWSNCSPGNSGTPCTPVPPPFLTASLAAAGIRYVVAGDENTFLTNMRTGAFSGAIIDQASPGEPRIAPEYLGDVEAGFGLLFIHSAPNAMPKLAPALATSFGGKLHGPTTLSVAATPFTLAGLLTLNGDGVKIALAGSAAAATIDGTDTPAITYNSYGRGKVVVVPFDLELTRTAAVADLIVAATRFISRTPAAPFDARTVVPLHFEVTTPPGSDVTVTLTVTLPGGVVVVDAAPPLTSLNPTTWQATIAGNTTAAFDLWLRAADSIGPYTVTAAATLAGAPPAATITIAVDVGSDGASIAAALQAELVALKNAATTNDDLRNATDAIAQLNAIMASPDALANVARATAILADLHAMSFDTSAARADAARLLVYWQSRVGA